MIQVNLYTNAFDSSDRETLEVPELLPCLVERFGTFPERGRIYHQSISLDHDVTPGDAAGVARLQTLPGPFHVVVWPGDPITIIVSILAVVAGVAAALLLIPPIDAGRNVQTTSPNNALSDRTNKPRPNGRIPDIYGTVRSTPDLLAVPYKVFKDHREVEVAYLCVGRGEYEIDDIYDDNTSVSDIEGMQVAVYGPGTSPLSGDAPQLSIGGDIDDELLDIRRSNAVNGQTIYPLNYKKVIGTDNFRAVSGGRFQVRDTAVFAWPDLYEVGDVVTVTNAIMDGKNLNGTYTVQALDDDYITWVNPAAVAPAWSTVTAPTGWNGPTFQIAVIPNPAPFFVDLEPDGKLIINLVALGGLYKENSDRQFAVDVTIQFALTPVDAAGVPTGGAVEYFTGTIEGSATTKSTRAQTVIAQPTLSSGRFKVEATRPTNTDYDFEGSVVDEVKWRDLYVGNPILVDEFGDVTTVFAVTYGTTGALAIKDRKLNMLATRKINLDTGSGPEVTTTATSDAGQILMAVARDPYIGGRGVDELDVQNILDTLDAVEAYFGFPGAREFNYTFDNASMSFEETANIIAAAVFCTAYRQGKQLRLAFERATEDSVLLFNHRNKLPGSETRTLTFGRSGGYDGVAYEYVDPEDDAVLTLYVPQGDDSAVKPRKVESFGIRSYEQAYLHAWRAWNKIKYQNTVTEFTATQEAELVIRTDRILVADNTRSGTWDGEVMSQDGLSLTLSQPFEPDVLDHFIFLQLSDGTTQAIEIASSPDPYTVVLADPPSLALALDEDLYARTTYMIQAAAVPRPYAFLVDEKVPQDDFTVVVRALNYDSRYYENDGDMAP